MRTRTAQATVSHLLLLLLLLLVIEFAAVISLEALQPPHLPAVVTVSAAVAVARVGMRFLFCVSFVIYHF